MELKRADKAGFDLRPQLSYIFVEGFYSWIQHFHKDKEKLKEVFTHIFNLKFFYVAMDGQTVASMVACTHGHTPINLDRKIFTKILGLIKGNFTYFMLKRHMVRNAYPFSLSPKTGTIEFVATAPEYRQKGLAEKLIKFTMEQNPYNSYVLEVADTNTNAFKLYEKMGFVEMKRIAAPNPKRSGVNNYLYMRKEI